MHPAHRMLVSYHIVASGGPGGFGGLQRYPSTPLLRRWTYEDTTFIAVQYQTKISSRVFLSAGHAVGTSKRCTIGADTSP